MKRLFVLISLVTLFACDSDPAPEDQPPYHFKANLKDQNQNITSIDVKYNESDYTENVSYVWGYGTSEFDPDFMDLDFSTEYWVNGHNNDKFDIGFSFRERKVDIDTVNHRYKSVEQMLEKFAHQSWPFAHHPTAVDRSVIIRYNAGDKAYFNFKNSNGWFDATNNSSNHHFTLTSIEPKTDRIHGAGFVVTGTFDFVLYNYHDPADSILVTEGSYQGFISGNKF